MNGYGPAVVPPGGFSYSKNGQHVIGVDRGSLINNLTEYRRANRLKIGNPEKDVDDWLAAKSPTYLPPLSKGRVVEPKDKPTSLLDRVKAWLANRKYGKIKLKYVDRAEADRRANICARCPQNRQWRSSCAPCVREIEHDAVVVGQNHLSALHDRLLACNIAGHENGVAVWLDESSLKHRVNYKLPSFCWLGKIDSKK